MCSISNLGSLRKSAHRDRVTDRDDGESVSGVPTDEPAEIGAESAVCGENHGYLRSISDRTHSRERLASETATSHFGRNPEVVETDRIIGRRDVDDDWSNSVRGSYSLSNDCFQIRFHERRWAADRRRCVENTAELPLTAREEAFRISKTCLISSSAKP